MKFVSTQLTYFFSEPEVQRNIRALIKYSVFVFVVIIVYSILFHVIMLNVEGERHSWLTGLYWTLTVMSTLGFGDITFDSDIGRLFSVVVLLSGIVLLLIMLPFAFIRYFYAPWLEAQIRFKAPRVVPQDVEGHVIICQYDTISPGLIRKLKFNKIPYFVIEEDPVVAARLHGDGVSVIAGEVESRSTYERARVDRARLLFANRTDTTNTNITLTVREVEADIPIVALAENADSVDILELSGATHVLALKQRLGEYLANRINVGGGRAHVIGRFKDLLIAEFPVHQTPLIGKTIRETRLRELTGTSVIGVWERGRLLPPFPEDRLCDFSVPVVIGSDEQICRLDDILTRDGVDSTPVLILGGGKVGRSAGLALKRKGIKVHMVERKEMLRERIGDIPDLLIIGDAADRKVLGRAGLESAPSVLLTTNDDAINIYLTVYCRRLKPDIHIVTRITHERNLEAIHRAGADIVLSYASLGRESVFSLLQGRDPVMLGEGVDLFVVKLPESLSGRTLLDSRIGARTGLVVVALQLNGESITNPSPELKLESGSRLVMLGTAEQREKFSREFLD